MIFVVVYFLMKIRIEKYFLASLAALEMNWSSEDEKGQDHLLGVDTVGGERNPEETTTFMFSLCRVSNSSIPV